MTLSIAENDFINKINLGDIELYSYFVNTYKNTLYNIALSILENDSYLAEEVVQIAFIKAYSNLKGFKKKSTFKTWIIRILINESFKIKKINSKINFIPVDSESKNIYDTTLTDSINQQDKENKIKFVMDKLNANESLALKLFYIEGYNIKEISKLTNWSIANTKVLLFRGRKNFVNLIKTYYK